MRQLQLPYIFRHPVILREVGEEGKADDEVFEGFIAPRSPAQREKLASLVQKHFMPRRKAMWGGYYDPDGSAFVAVAVVYGACLYALDAMVKVYQYQCVRPTCNRSTHRGHIYDHGLKSYLIVCLCGCYRWGMKPLDKASDPTLTSWQEIRDLETDPRAKTMWTGVFEGKGKAATVDKEEFGLLLRAYTRCLEKEREEEEEVMQEQEEDEEEEEEGGEGDEEGEEEGDEDDWI
jgi:hypothetical protein